MAAKVTQVPDGWRVVRLGDVCSAPQYGAAASARDYAPNLPRYVRISDITDDGRLKAEDLKSANPEQVQGFALSPGDLLFARSGSVGRTYLYRSSDGPCVFAGYLIRFRPIPDLALPEYLEHWTHSQAYFNWVNAVSRQGAQTNINAREYASLRIPLPPLPEQRAIAAVLDGIDDAIEASESVASATETLRDSLLHELLTRGVPGWHADWREARGVGTVPASWEVVRLGEVVELAQPGAWGQAPTYDKPGVRVLRAADLTRDGRVSLDNAAWRRLSERDLERRLMRDGDIMLERSGGGPGTPVGRVALIEGLGQIYCNNFCQQLRVDRNRCIPKYAVRALWHRYLRGVTARLEHQTTGIRNLDYGAYMTFRIPLPSLPEQKAIVAMLDSVEVAISHCRRETDMLDSLKRSTADALLTGRVRIIKEH